MIGVDTACSFAPERTARMKLVLFSRPTTDWPRGIANNAAAASYRSAEMRTVSSDGFTNGALVAPLITPDGCIGVLSAEMKGGSERDEAAQALAAIFAAQLATLVSAPAAAHARTAAQA